jgi:hypothetical protein
MYHIQRKDKQKITRKFDSKTKRDNLYKYRVIVKEGGKILYTYKETSYIPPELIF